MSNVVTELISDNVIELLIQNELKNDTSCDNLSASFESLLERGMNEIKKQEVLKKYRPRIKQLPSGSWYIRINGKKIERVNLADLENFILERHKEENKTFNSIFDQYISRRKMIVADTTWAKDLNYYNQYLKESPLACIPLTKIKLADGYNFVNHCLTVNPKIKYKYWLNIKGFLNQLIQYCIDEGYMNSNPFFNLKPKSDLFATTIKTRDGDTVFTKEEQYAVCCASENDCIVTQTAIPLSICLLFDLGLRIAELCALKWKDIEFTDKPYIHIQREQLTNITEDGKCNGYKIVEHCKSDAGNRRIRLNTSALDILSRVKQLNYSNNLSVDDDSFIFLKNDGISISHRSIDSRLRKYCKSAGMHTIKSVHDIRRSVLTNLYNAGMPLKAIQSFAGHSSLKQTMDYIRVSDCEIDITDYIELLS